jgi:hypothetical protein
MQKRDSKEINWYGFHKNTSTFHPTTMNLEIFITHNSTQIFTFSYDSSLIRLIPHTVNSAEETNRFRRLYHH